MESAEQQDKRKTTNWLYVALAATIMYAVAMWSVIGNERLSAFFDTPELNEIGDFLAGMFAPIALVWLVAAVLTQRQELNETREQFDASQRVIQKQMENAEKQIENANKQASINAMHLNLAQESARKAYRLTLFDKRFEIFNELLLFIRAHPSHEYGKEDLDVLREIIKKSAFLFSLDIENWLREVAGKVYALMEEEKGFEFTDDGYGNQSVQMGKTDARKVKQLRIEIKQMLSDDQLMMRFWKTMHVSDEDDSNHPMNMFG